MEESSDKLKAQEWHPLEILELGIDIKRFKNGLESNEMTTSPMSLPTNPFED